jgi:CRP-like cAMP-binding protein
LLQDQVQNRLLRKLTREDYQAVSASMELVELPLKQEILRKGQVIDYVYLPEDCICSILACTDSVDAIEVGMFGYEGMSDFGLREGDRTDLSALVQLAGTAWRIRAKDFIGLLRTQPSLNEVVLRYRTACAVQFAYTALSHGSFTIEARLARWLLMSHDRARRETIPMVHEFLAMMLAVRRSGITTAIHVLEGRGAIRAVRGAITIRDREKLRELAGESYGDPELAYERLMSY